MRLQEQWLKKEIVLSIRKQQIEEFIKFFTSRQKRAAA